MRKIIRSDGTEEQLPTRQSMDQIHELIGAGTIDTVLLKDRLHVMIVDDIGHAKGLPINGQATNLYWQKWGGPNDHYIVGDVFICLDADFGG